MFDETIHDYFFGMTPAVGQVDIIVQWFWVHCPDPGAWWYHHQGVTPTRDATAWNFKLQLAEMVGQHEMLQLAADMLEGVNKYPELTWIDNLKESVVKTNNS